MNNLIEYSNAYSKTSGSLRQYYRDEQALDNNGNIIDFPANDNRSISFNFKQEITRQTGNGSKNNGSIKRSTQFLENTWNVFN